MINNILYNQLNILEICNSLVSNEYEKYCFSDININLDKLLTNEQLDTLLSEIIINENTPLIAMGLLYSLGITDKAKYVIDNSNVYLNNDIKVILLNVYSELINGIEYEKRTKKEFFDISITNKSGVIKIDFTLIMIIAYFQVIYDHLIKQFTISIHTGYYQIKSRIFNYVYNVYVLLIGYKLINENKNHKLFHSFIHSRYISLYDMFICGSEYLTAHNLNKKSSKFNFFIKHWFN